MAAFKSIGFVSCPENMRLDTVTDLQKLEDALGYLIELDAQFINVTCARTGVDMSRILHDVKPFIDKKLISVAQPAGRPAGSSCTETSISFWSNSFATSCGFNDIDPEGNVPATGFFFDTNIGKIGVFATVWPALPGRTRTRLLQAYLNSTDVAQDDRVLGVAPLGQLVAAGVGVGSL